MLIRLTQMSMSYGHSAELRLGFGARSRTESPLVGVFSQSPPLLAWRQRSQKTRSEGIPDEETEGPLVLGDKTKRGFRSEASPLGKTKGVRRMAPREL
jgi:hypothetical protein